MSSVYARERYFITELVTCPTIVMDHAVLSTNDVTVGAEVIMVCDDGYSLSIGLPAVTFTCGSSGDWNLDPSNYPCGTLKLKYAMMYI